MIIAASHIILVLLVETLGQHVSKNKSIKLRIGRINAFKVEQFMEYAVLLC
jgi:hypothetical protein